MFIFTLYFSTLSIKTTITNYYLWPCYIYNRFMFKINEKKYRFKVFIHKNNFIDIKQTKKKLYD